MALAIMAFEEAGKGHSHELEARHDRKKGKIRSSHQFRHLMSALVLTISLHQKYGLNAPDFTDEQQEKIREHYDKARNFSEFASTPAPDEVRKFAASHNLDQLNGLPHDQRIIALTEFNWVIKAAKASATGEVERLRQKGFYVDFDEGDVLTRPSDVKKEDAYRWIWNAKRAVNLLAFGLYFQPYSELAAFLEGLPKPLPAPEELLKMVLEQANAAGSASNNSEDDENGPYGPFSEQQRQRYAAGKKEGGGGE